ncbi:hypothetical protein ABRP17_016370 [Stenotrophomonas sp. WHRI 8082]|uniref:hypothetical protein n=1 Tax=Stenotrophomonas sp. WHRI 8082 TaxID=3162571 RepID=UPI0032ED3F69
MQNPYFEKFDQIGESEVRARLSSGRYRAESHQRAAAVEWLAHRDYAANLAAEEDRKASLRHEGVAAKAASSSAVAAWVSAVIAILALLVAGVALWVSLQGK